MVNLDPSSPFCHTVSLFKDTPTLATSFRLFFAVFFFLLFSRSLSGIQKGIYVVFFFPRIVLAMFQLFFIPGLQNSYSWFSIPREADAFTLPIVHWLQAPKGPGLSLVKGRRWRQNLQAS